MQLVYVVMFVALVSYIFGMMRVVRIGPNRLSFRDPAFWITTSSAIIVAVCCIFFLK